MKKRVGILIGIPIAVLSFVLSYFLLFRTTFETVDLSLSKITALPNTFVAAATYLENEEHHSLVLTSNDAGRTWREVGLRMEGEAYDMAAFGDKHVWILTMSHGEEGVAKPSELVFSADSCKTWHHLPLDFVECKTGLVERFQLQFSDSKNGVIVIAEVHNAPAYYATSDGGYTWKKVDGSLRANELENELNDGLYTVKPPNSSIHFRFVKRVDEYIIQTSSVGATSWRDTAIMPKRYKLEKPGVLARVIRKTLSR